MAFVYISFLLVKVVNATLRPWKGCKSGRKCGEVDENMSEQGNALKPNMLANTALVFPVPVMTSIL